MWKWVGKVKPVLTEGVSMKRVNIANIKVKSLYCPHCNFPHSDVDDWALYPHKTHLCLVCGLLFEDPDNEKSVSNPQFTWKFIFELLKDNNEKIS